MKRAYDANSITVHTTMEGIRSNVGMYLGSIDEIATLQCLREVLNNSTDELEECGGGAIKVVIKGNNFTVADEGRGIPIDLHPKTKRPAIETVLTKLHAGGKSGDKTAYGARTIGCFIGSTRIRLLDGRSVRIDELAKEFKETGKKHWVYSFNPKTGRAFEPNKAYGVFATRVVNKITRVILDNGRKIFCTPDHPFISWKGEKIKASELKCGTSLRALHIVADNLGYLTHSGAKRKVKPVQTHLYRVQRTVALGMGWDIKGKDVAHKNAIKHDNRPENLKPMNRMDHFWYDNEKHGRGKDYWSHKNKTARKISEKNIRKINKKNTNTDDVQIGRYVQTAARAIRDYGKVNEETFNFCRCWCGPKYDKAIKYFKSRRDLTFKAREYLNKYGKKGKIGNGGNGLNCKLESEYKRSPSVNFNNHKVVSVCTYTTEKPIQVYGMSVENDHNYLLDAGVFVKNTHGVGSSVVNALSTKLTAWSYRKGWWRIDFSKGVVVKELHKARPPFPWKKGTIVQYELDQSILKSPIDPLHARQLCNVTRHFYPVDIDYTDGQKHLELVRRKPENLLHRMLKKEGLTTIFPDVVIRSNGVCLVCCWTNSTSTVIDAYVSGAAVPSGMHVNGLKEAIEEAVRGASPREAKNCSNVLVGLRALIDVTVDQPEFSGQAKTNLRTASAKRQVKEAVILPLTKLLKKNRVDLKVMLEHATKISKIDDDHKTKKKLAEDAIQPRGRLSFPKGFKAALSFPASQRELYLCEGDSAGGSLISAKMPYQEILPLRGKIANVISKSGKVQKSEVVSNILSVIGFNPSQPERPLRVGKVIILTDADEDGFHISSLLLAVFQQLMPTLFKAGRVYIVDTPLFEAVDRQGSMVSGDVLADMERKYGKLHSVNRMKGLGGCEVPLLRRVATNPATRKLLQVAPPSSKEATMLVELMGKDSAIRKLRIGNIKKGSENECVGSKQ